MKDLLYPLFFLIAFTLIGSYMVRAWELAWDRVEREVQQAGVMR